MPRAALSPTVIAGLQRSSGAQLFTMGFTGSTGQQLGAILADSMGGGYYLASDSTTPGGMPQAIP